MEREGGWRGGGVEGDGERGDGGGWRESGGQMNENERMNE